MNIVIVTDNAHINGGAGKIALASAQGLGARGHRVIVVSAVGPVDPELANVPGLTVECSEQFEILNDPNRLRAMTQGLWNPRAGEMMARVLAPLDPGETVVHLHLWAKALSSSVMRVAIDSGFKTACTLHDYLLMCPTGTLFHHGEQRICRRKPMSVDCLTTNCDTRHFAHKVWRSVRHSVQTTAGKIPSQIDQFIAISDLSYSVMKPALPARAKVEFISNFVDAVERPAAPVESNTKFVFSGRLVREKAPALFAQCAAEMNLEAVFIGEGECREEVLRAYPSASITGWLPYQQTIDTLRSARALVFPSLWYEGQPLVILEAAANGIPAIVADTSAARDMVVDGVTGLWFRSGDAADLKRKLAALQDARYAASLGKAAYARYWADPPTLDAHVTKLEAVYRKLLKPHTASEERGSSVPLAEPVL